jgi:hypothetical protein
MPRSEVFWRVGVLGTLLVFLRLYTPGDDGPVLCLFRRLTGHDCPLCGMTRALCCLAKGEWMAGIHYHPLSPVVLAGILYLLVKSATGQARTA